MKYQGKNKQAVMTLNATIIKVMLSISNIDQHFYVDRNFVLAQHPAENTQRMMLSVIAYILFAEQQPEFSRGIRASNEPVLWKKSLIGEVELWIEIGHPDIKKLRKACQQSQQVVVMSYGDVQLEMWQRTYKKEINMFDNLRILHIVDKEYQSLADFKQRQLHLAATIQDGEVWLSSEQTATRLTPAEVFCLDGLC